MSGDGNPRRHRVAQEMRDALAEMLEREVKDPRISAAGLVSVSHVELNRDMSTARVSLSFYGADEPAIARAMAGFERAAGFLRGPLARRMRLRHAPALRFVRDTSIELSHRITDLVREDTARLAPDGGPEASELPTGADRAGDQPGAGGGEAGEGGGGRGA